MSFLKSLFGEGNNDESSKMNWIALASLQQLDEIIEQSTSKAIVIFKHSTRCGVSRMVLNQFEKEYLSEDKVDLYFLDLLNHRDISNEIANRFEVVHQSPQLLLIKNGVVVYDASHNDINAMELENFI
ncbi:bacillithiol system redox-active protein YtxJ [Flavobacterium sp.]|uniref:bacillithiol system redox-active protein YtxJ n=1 Tax=Flavobacterium sp. TaxID=239 RepID=UPI003529578D